MTYLAKPKLHHPTLPRRALSARALAEVRNPVVAFPAVAVPATPIQSRLSLTGANTARFAAIALALVVAGSLAVVLTRRRRESTTA